MNVTEGVSHEVVSDGRTVWVHGGGDGSTLARFGRFGIDVHRSTTDQLAGRGECLHCTHEDTTAADWEDFKAKVLEHHQIRIADRHMPDRLRIRQP